MVEHDAGRNVSEWLEQYVEPEARPDGARCDEDVAPAQLPPLHAGEGDGDALPGLGSLDRPVVHLHASNPHAPAARFHTELVSLADRPRPERPGCDRPDAVQRERAVDVKPRRTSRVVSRDLRRDLCQRGPQVVEAGTGARARRDDRCAGRQLLRLDTRELERLGVDEVGLRERDDTLLDPEQPEDREVLALYYVQKRTTKEIAQVMSVAPGTIMARLFRAREKLRRQMTTEDAQ